MRDLVSRIVLISIAALSSFSAQPSHAEVSLPAIWADHAVVQRNLPVRVWGKAAPGETVSISFRNQRGSATADDLGRWQIDLPGGDAGGPFSMEIQGTNRIVLSDVLVGDVWFASGQSNMEFSTKEVIHADEELKKANQPNIHLFHVEKRSADFPQDDVVSKSWTACTPESVADFSAVAYFFALNIQADQHVPIGLIEADWGGTPAETWTSVKAMSADASLMPAFATWGQMTELETERLLTVAKENKEKQAALAQGKPEPTFDWHPELRSWLPGGAFNGMVAPLTRFPIRGALWYQGESNAGKERVYYYQSLMRTLIQDWRTRWAEGDFPFLLVQLANFNTNPEWAELREAQRRTLDVSNTGLAVAIDIGDADNIHPKNKQEVGRRLSLAARVVAYREDIEDSGPMYRMSISQSNSVRVFFDHLGGGLVAKGSELTGFEVAGKDGKFYPAKAAIEGDTVVATASEVNAPMAVRYGWAANPRCNLYNKADLPASPFSSLP